jgi:hypothetical protein
MGCQAGHIEFGHLTGGVVKTAARRILAQRGRPDLGFGDQAQMGKKGSEFRNRFDGEYLGGEIMEAGGATRPSHVEPAPRASSSSSPARQFFQKFSKRSGLASVYRRGPASPASPQHRQ